MSTMLTIIDAEATVRTWARAESHIHAVIDDRVFFATPQAYEKSKPKSWVVMTLISETHEADDLGMQLATIQFDCVGNTKATAASVAIAVQAAGRQLYNGAQAVVGNVVIATGNVTAKRWYPDPVTNTPRYLVDILFSLFGPEA